MKTHIENTHAERVRLFKRYALSKKVEIKIKPLAESGYYRKLIEGNW